MAQITSRIDNQQLIDLLKDPEVQLLDVRTTEETSKGIIKGATIIDFYDAEFESKLEQQLNNEKPIVVYCAAGGRSAKTVSKLKELGFGRIYDLKEGFRGWKAGDHPITKP